MFEQAFRNIDDVLWKEAGCTTELDYTEQTSWVLFLKYLDDLEKDKAMEAKRILQLEQIEAIKRRLWSAAYSSRANSYCASNEFDKQILGASDLRQQAYR